MEYFEGRGILNISSVTILSVLGDITDNNFYGILLGCIFLRFNKII